MKPDRSASTAAHHMIGRALRIALLAVLVFALAPRGAMAAPAPDAPPDAPPEQTPRPDADDARAEAGAAAEAASEAPTRDVETPDVFIPSVEVSEDLSVAFPVDI